VYSINTDQIAEITGVPLTGSYLQLVEDQPGGLGVIGLPHLDSGPFLSYGIQWIAFGVIAPVGVGYFVVAEYKQRRRERAAVATSASAAASAVAAGEPVKVSKDEKLADRYGRRR
jgi:cytochrome oxidase assembly protein ShyY1